MCTTTLGNGLVPKKQLNYSLSHLTCPLERVFKIRFAVEEAKTRCLTKTNVTHTKAFRRAIDNQRKFGTIVVTSFGNKSPRILLKNCLMKSEQKIGQIPWNEFVFLTPKRQ